MTEAEQSKPGLVARIRARRQDRRERRAWRRERRRNANFSDAHSRAESSNYAQGGFFTTGRRD